MNDHFFVFLYYVEIVFLHRGAQTVSHSAGRRAPLTAALYRDHEVFHATAATVKPHRQAWYARRKKGDGARKKDTSFI